MIANNPSARIFFGICDLKSAFRLIPLSRKFWPLLIMKAEDELGNWKFFVDKCLPFSASISCKIFQRYSNALAHLLKYLKREGWPSPRVFGLSNYLDDFLHFAMTEVLCNAMLKKFQELCDLLGMPMAKEKTVWASI